MIRRTHDQPGRRSEALHSVCGHYRYLLTRRWGPGGTLLYVMLNPSTADERKNDPTIERCERRARAAGFGAFAVANLFAWKATLPADLKRAADPVGAPNDEILLTAAAQADLVLCGWGTHGAHLGRGAEVRRRLAARSLPLWSLGLTKEGHPRHPLYVAYAAAPQRWDYP
jgi:hypothetical protein